MKQKLFNLTLSTLFVAVLAACGSSKSEDMPKPKPDENTKPEMSQEEKNKIEEQAKQKGYLELANKKQFQSLQAAKNTKSDLGTNPRTKTSNYYEGILNENTDVGTFNLNQDLDNIVVASLTKETQMGVYLEDFQFTQGVLAETTGLLAKDASETVVETLIGTHFDALASDKDFADKVKEKREASDTTLKNATDTYKGKANPTPQEKQTYDKAVIQHKIEQAALDALAVEASTVEIKAATDAKDIADKVKGMKAILAVAGGDLSIVKAREDGKQKIGDANKGIYFDNKVTATGGDVRATPVHTETGTVGKATNKEAFVYQTARKVYITADTQEESDKLAKRVKENAALDGGAVRVMKDSVAEVYGNKTFGVEHRGPDSYAIINDNGVNAPFQKMVGKDKKGRDVYAPDRLDYVQYGRVTSKLDEVTKDDLKEGIWANTKVGAYGKYGADGTENHYFARGYNNASKAALGNEGIVTYYGHAVTYGLDHNQNGRDTNAIPNALGGQDAILSGTHVKATINLANNSVEGSLYNIWGDSNTSRRVPLVKFEGVIGANGNMAGESELAYKPESKGSFLAALYGEKGEEMAGKVQSHDRDAKNGWVGVFGAKKAVEKAAGNSGSPFVPSNQAGSNSAANNAGAGAGAAAGATAGAGAAAGTAASQP